METLPIEHIVDEFWRHRERGVYFPPEWMDQLTLDQAYLVQLGLMDRYVAAGAQQVGWKVGLTSNAMQQQFQVHEPLFGYLLESASHPDGARFLFGQLIKPGVENELCMTMGADLHGPGIHDAQALQAVAGVRPALEVIETRGDLTGQLALAITDNIQQRAIVLGSETSPLPADLDLPAVRVAVLINDRQVAESAGAAVLGHPIRSIVWLANKLAQYGRSLKAGQLIMTGSLTRQFPVAQGQMVTAHFDPLGTVSASFV